MRALNVGRSVALGLGAAALIGAATGARADIVPWAFEGRVTSIDNPGGLTTPIEVGQPVSGTFTFADLTLDVLETPDGGVAYLFFAPDFPNPPYGVSATIGDATVVSGDFGPSLNVVVYDGTGPSGGDALYLVDSEVTASFALPPLGFAFMSLSLEDTSGQMLSSDALPLEPPDLASLTLAEGTFAVLDADTGEFVYTATFSVDSLSLVPSPGVGVMLIAGVLGWGRRRRGG